MRKIIAAEFVSLDGVFESPEKWHFPYFNEEMGQAIGESFAASDAMLMGRVLYTEWAAFWPKQDPRQNPIAAQMNAIRKYVVSTTLEGPLGWSNSTLIEGNVAAEILELKAAARQGHRDLWQRHPRAVAAPGRPARRAAAHGPPDGRGERQAPCRRGGRAEGAGASGLEDVRHGCRVPHLPAGRRVGHRGREAIPHRNTESSESIEEEG